MDVAQVLWQLLINPNIAYLLLIIGLWSAITAFVVPGTGLPEAIAALFVDSDTGVSRGALFDDGHQLSKLIGRPTTSLETAIAAAMR